MNINNELVEVWIDKRKNGDLVRVAGSKRMPLKDPYDLVARAYSENRVIVIEDYSRDPDDLVDDPEILSQLVVPIHGDSGRSIGVFNLQSREKEHFTRKDVESVEREARDLGRALDALYQREATLIERIREHEKASGRNILREGK